MPGTIRLVLISFLSGVMAVMGGWSLQSVSSSAPQEIICTFEFPPLAASDLEGRK